MSTRLSTTPDRPDRSRSPSAFDRHNVSVAEPSVPYSLEVPSYKPSRPSLDSTYTELSELSFLPNEIHTQNPLIARALRPDGPLAIRSLRSRALCALRNFYHANYGALLVLVSQMFGVGMNISTRLLETAGKHGEPMHPFQILLVRQSITAALCTCYGLYTKSVPDFPLGPRSVRWLLVIRGLFGFFGVFGMYFSLLYLPLSEATVLTFLAPILTCYLCSLVIPGETFTGQQQMAGLLSLVGVVFIARPSTLFASTAESPPSTHIPLSNSTLSSDEPHQSSQQSVEHHLEAVGIAMLGVVGATGALTSIRVIGTRAHAFISINYFSVWCSFVSLGCLVVFPDVRFRLPGNLTEWSLLASLGFCGFVMQFLLTAGLAYGGPSSNPPTREDRVPRYIQQQQTGDEESAGSDGADTVLYHDPGEQKQAAHAGAEGEVKISGTRATSMVYTQMLFALAGDKLVFDATPGTMSWIGSVLILAGAIWVASARVSIPKDEGVSSANASEQDLTSVASRSKDRVPVGQDEGASLLNASSTGDDEDDDGPHGHIYDEAGLAGVRGFPAHKTPKETAAETVELRNLRGSQSL